MWESDAVAEGHTQRVVLSLKTLSVAKKIYIWKMSEILSRRNGGFIVTEENKVGGEKFHPLRLCPRQILHGLPWNR